MVLSVSQGITRRQDLHKVEALVVFVAGMHDHWVNGGNPSQHEQDALWYRLVGRNLIVFVFLFMAKNAHALSTESPPFTTIKA